MKKIAVLYFTAVMVVVFGLTITYAAFPVRSHNTTENVVTNQSTATISTVQAPVATETTTTNKTEHSNALGGKSQVIALILCICVGGLGIHRFYLGYTWQGIVQLLTLGGCGIWSLIDLIRIITGDLQPKDGSYDQTL